MRNLTIRYTRLLTYLSLFPSSIYRLSHTVFLTTLFFFRVEQYIETGRDQNIVDPDPNGLYTKRKRQRSELNKDVSFSQSQGDKTTSSVDYPTEGWSTLLTKLPVFTGAEMNEHIARTGKNIGNKDHHSVPTAL